MKKIQIVMTAAAFAIAIGGAFVSKANSNRLPDVWGKEVSGDPCTALCINSGTTTCTKSSVVGFFQTNACSTAYTGNRFERP